MKYCLKWVNISQRLNEADEISIFYREDKGLISFLQKYENKRINLYITTKTFEESEIEKLAAIRKQYPELNFAVALDTYDEALMNTLKEKNISYYIIEPCQNWELFYHLIKNCGVSDVNLSGALAFELPKVKSLLEKLELKVQIRLTPNAAQAQTVFAQPLQKFFIRPEDLELYEPYVDVIEFEGVAKQDAFFDIYAKNKLFIGKLNQIIYYFYEPIDNLGLTTQFGERRISCGRECLKGGRCQRCFTMAEIAKKTSQPIRETIKENLEKQLEEKSNEKK